MYEILQDLNASQREAVTATEGFIRVIAGAGSGKTRALSHRFAYLVNDLGILPGNILCVTFTNKSANEMRQRIHNLTGDNDTGYINTFHGFCVSILQEDSHAVQYPKNFLVLDNSDIDDMLKIIYEERGLTLRNMTFGQARDMIEIQKLNRRPDYYMDMITMSLETLHQKYMQAEDVADIIFYGYLYQEKKCFGLDYNDLIKFSLYIFEQNPDICLKWQQRLEYIMIDEFQDIDDLQYTLMKVLCGYHGNLFIVGDPDQTIYTWRGANVKYLLDFDKNFPKVRTIMMMENYRSTPEILAVANSLVAKNKNRIPKDLEPATTDGRPIAADLAVASPAEGMTSLFVEKGPKALCKFADTTDKEAAWMADEMIRLHEEEGVPYRSMTVLYRAHYITRTIEETFMKRQIPYHIFSGVQFFSRMEIKDALSYLRMISYKDDLSFRRVVNQPKRNIGQRRMAFLESYAEEHGCTLYAALQRNLEHDIFRGTGAHAFVELIESFAANYAQRPVSEVLADILNQSGYEIALRTEGSQERLDNLAELKQSVFEYETTCGEEVTLESYMSHIALFTNSDTAENGDKVKLMTVHTAKGLEFPYVFLVSMNEGIFPSKKTRTEQGMEEERRLAFVAVTRARKRLYLSEAGGRNFDGSPRYPSRFLLDIDSKYLDFVEEPSENLILETKEYIRLTSRYLKEEDGANLRKIGERVHHPVFGDGTIQDLDTEKSAYIIQFDEIKTPRSISFRAKLK